MHILCLLANQPQGKQREVMAEYARCRCCSAVECRMGINTLLCIVWPHTDTGFSFISFFCRLSLFFIWSLSCTQIRQARQPFDTSTITTILKQQPGSSWWATCQKTIKAGRYLCDVLLMEMLRVCRGPFIICIARDWHFDSLPTTTIFMAEQNLDIIGKFSTFPISRFLIFAFSSSRLHRLGDVPQIRPLP